MPASSIHLSPFPVWQVNRGPSTRRHWLSYLLGAAYIGLLLTWLAVVVL
ncbi:hypothetical protein [Terriglobus roseus]|uniref:Uncharacterized protein n=1 Tax=Terriglobus roseus TaxID=392734 RepID=A0A1H4J9N7_9BACT|nr:hypothetical protein [Terriglobus roseus]SEB42282.1 hypothetical protein SAMN05443244_0425 [Terriglobus roseus]